MIGAAAAYSGCCAIPLYKTAYTCTPAVSQIILQSGIIATTIFFFKSKCLQTDFDTAGSMLLFSPAVLRDFPLPQPFFRLLLLFCRRL